jgi:uncharacterized protein YbjQ (UPF0145 family)
MSDLIIFLTLLVIGYISGSIIEKKHFKSIIEREAQLRSIRVIGVKRVPERFNKVESQLVQGSVVISIDYFKKIAAGLRSFFGGRVSSYETLVERARREAILRMKQDAADWGAQAIFNQKIETASVSQGAKGQVGAVEVYAYGTALRSTKGGQP